MEKHDYKVEILKNPGEYDLNFKLIVIGDSGVGKSCLSIKATKDTFDKIYSPTIGFEFMTLFLKVEDYIIKLQIWDTCGQEVYRSLITSFYHNSSLAILVYSIDDNNSFLNLNSWLNEVRINGNPDINIFLVGNKVDLEDQRQVATDKAQEFSENNDIKLFLETSAKTGFNVKNVFIEAGKLLYKQHLYYKNKISNTPETIEKSNTTKISMEQECEKEENKKKKKKCCS